MMKKDENIDITSSITERTVPRRFLKKVILSFASTHLVLVEENFNVIIVDNE